MTINFKEGNEDFLLLTPRTIPSPVYTTYKKRAFLCLAVIHRTSFFYNALHTRY